MRVQANIGFGDVTQLRPMDLPKPLPGPDDLLLRTAAAGVNHVDWQLREGWFADSGRFRFPFVPGWDVCGTVEEVGAHARERFSEGDLVFAYCRDETDLAADGAYAEYVRVAARSCAHAPDNIPPEQLAVMPLVSLTAAQLVAAADVAPGDTVLVLGASGAVGRQALARAGALGAAVIAGVRPRHLVGAAPSWPGAESVVDSDQVLDPRYHPAATQLADVLLDCGAAIGVSAAARLLRPGGRFLSIMRPPSPAAAERAGITATHVFSRPDGAELDRIAREIATGAVPLPTEVEVMDLEFAGSAQEKLKNGSSARISLRVREY